MVTNTRQMHVRISQESHKLLQEWAADTGDSMSSIVERAIESYRRAQIFAEAERGYRELENDPEALAEYEAEIALWDQTVADGLEPEKW